VEYVEAVDPEVYFEFIFYKSLGESYAGGVAVSGVHPVDFIDGEEMEYGVHKPRFTLEEGYPTAHIVVVYDFGTNIIIFVFSVVHAY